MTAEPPTPDGSLDDPETELDRLFARPPGEFVAARDALATRARRAGDRSLAQRVKGLRRPTVSAWVVNLLSRGEPEPVAELLELGEALRAAHRTLSADALRPLAAQRTAVVEALTRRAAILAAEQGRPASEAVRAEVAASLQAAMADPAVAQQVRAGRLTRAASYSGFGLVPETEGPGDAPAVVSLEQARTRRRGRQERAVEQARAEAARSAARRLDAAEDDLTTARAVVSEAEENHLEAAEELDRRSQEVADLQAELERAEDAEQQAQQAAGQTQQAVAMAARTLTEAEGEHERARQALDALRD